MGKLFWKFLLVFWLALLTAGSGVGVVVWLRHQELNEQHPLPGLRAAEPFLAAAHATLAHGGAAALRELLRDWQRERKPPIFAVDENGTEILGRNVTPEALSEAETLAGSIWFLSPLQRKKADNGHSYLIFPVLPQPEQLAYRLFRRLHQPPSYGMRPPPPNTIRTPPSPLLLAAAGAGASLLFSVLLAWYFAKPIRNLRTAFNAAAQGNLDVRVGTTMGRRRDELTDLGKDFDRMAGQIQRLMQAQQRLLHDVSHELRSPLARMQAAIGLAHQQPDKITLTLERIERESQRMDELVGELLTLSRLEAGVVGKIQDEIDVGELLADIVDDAGFEAESKSVNIDYLGQGEKDVMLKGQYELIHRAVENVLRNAIQHSEPGGKVWMHAQYDAGRRCLTISVEDHGPGVPEAELTAIFEPFYRSGDTLKEKSAGLGLSIARRAIEAHGGKITAYNRTNGGLRVEMCIPYDG